MFPNKPILESPKPWFNGSHPQTFRLEDAEPSHNMSAEIVTTSLFFLTGMMVKKGKYH